MLSGIELVQQVRDALAASNCKLVLAESCTAGNVAAALAVVPGISAWLCGGFVVYRNESKAQWLGIPRELLDDPEIGPVSPQVTRLLASSALEHTREADLAAAVTGHIGPGCPVELDGQVFLCITRRSDQRCFEFRRHLSAPAPQTPQDLVRRHERLAEATNWVMQCLLQSLPNR